MKVSINCTPIHLGLMQVPDFNFGQFQRWKNHERIIYQIEIEISSFVNLIEGYFNEFRTTEIEDNDDFDLTELISYKNLGYPTLTEMLTNHQEILSDLIIFNSYEILHILLSEKQLTEAKHFYSVNSIDTIRFINSNVLITGVCFKVSKA